MPSGKRKRSKEKRRRYKRKGTEGHKEGKETNEALVERKPNTQEEEPHVAISQVEQSQELRHGMKKNPILVAFQTIWAKTAALLWGPGKRTLSQRNSSQNSETNRAKKKVKNHSQVGEYSREDIRSVFDKKQYSGKKRKRDDPESVQLKQNEGKGDTLSPRSQRPNTVRLTIEKLRFHTILGEGSYGRVFLATDLIRKQHVAVKRVQKSDLLLEKDGSVERRVLEVANKCPFLIHGYGAFQTELHLYYVMELATGGTLDTYIIRNGPLPMNIVTFIAAELVCGLQFLHKQGMIHRDFKPLNVLLTVDGHAKIMDFGMVAENIFERSIEETYAGTTIYKAPEVIKSLPYNQGVDWFAYGITLYRMMMKFHPFHSTNTARKILTMEPRYEGLSPQSKDILQQLLCKDESCRLGVHGEIRLHPFFHSIHWGELQAGRTESPIKMPNGSLHQDLKKNIILATHSKPLRIYESQQAELDKVCFVCSDWAKHYHNEPLRDATVPAQNEDDPSHKRQRI